ncbi:MAG: transposase [Deinococcota bacterium]|nr:transposase [Deinococcota bacterium]
MMEKQLQRSSEVSVPRKFSAQYKLGILAEIEAATQKGQVGQVLRREGLYSSLISEWRRQRERGTLEAMNAKQRGPKTNKLAEEVKCLREQNARLEERLGTAEALIEAQGNAFTLLQKMSRKSDEAK